MMKPCILNKKRYALLFGVFFGCVALWSFAARANVCFLPDMDNCADSSEGYGIGGADASTDNCIGYNLSTKKTGGGWACDECGGKYKCQCSKSGYELLNGDCVKKAYNCKDDVYIYSSDIGYPWGCEKCTDSKSRNYDKYKCKCIGLEVNGECQKEEGSCKNQDYPYSSSSASDMRSKGYTCDKCTDSQSSNYDNYKCYCPSGTHKELTVSGVKKCFQECSDDKKELNNEGNCVCKTEYVRLNDGRCSSCTYTDTTSPSRGYSCDSCERDGTTYYGNCTCDKLDNVDDEGNPSGYEEVRDGKTYCYDCFDENDPNRPCQGKYHCKGKRLPIGSSTCSCHDIPFYDGCVVKEDCLEISSKYINGVKHNAYFQNTKTSCRGGIYAVYPTGVEVCKTVDLKPLYWCAECRQRGTDVAGNLTPLSRAEAEQGVTLQMCSGEGYGKSAKVCNVTFYENCDTCPPNTTYFNGVKHYAVDSGPESCGSYSIYSHYPTGAEACTTRSGSKTYYWCAECRQRGTDVAGNLTPLSRAEAEQGVTLKMCDGEGYGKSAKVCNVTFYENCDTCPPDPTYFNGVKHYAVDSGPESCGSYSIYSHYPTGAEACTTRSGSKTYYWCAECHVRGTDASGKLTPLSQAEADLGVTLTKCTDGTFGFPHDVKICNIHYGENCIAKCNYNYKYEDCPSTFVEKCKDGDGIIWGECGE